MTTAPDACQVLIEEISCRHCTELFKSYSVELSSTQVEGLAGSALLYCGIIGFTGEGIRGSIAIAASGSLLGASNPVPGGAPRDWVAELVNQLMGHVKSRLLGYSVEVYMSTPIVLRGERLALESRGVGRPNFFATPSADGHLALWVDVETAPDFKMAAEENTALSGLDGGNTLMF